MKTWKFQLAVAVTAGLFVSQTVQAIQFYSLRTVEVDNNGEPAFEQTVVVIDTVAGTVTDAAKTFESAAGTEVIAIDVHPGNAAIFGDGDIAGLTRDGQIRLLPTGFPAGEFDGFPFTIVELLNTTDGSISFPDGGDLAINTDVNDVEGAGLFQNFNVLRTDLTTAPDDLFVYGGSGLGDSSSVTPDNETSALSSDINATSIFHSVGNTLFAIGDAQAETDGNAATNNDGLFTLDDDPKDAIAFGQVTALNGEVFPVDSFNTWSTFGSGWTLSEDENSEVALYFVPDPNADPNSLAGSVGQFRFVGGPNNDVNLLNGLIGLARVPGQVVDAVPEPVTGVLGLLGLAALGAATRRRVA